MILSINTAEKQSHINFYNGDGIFFSYDWESDRQLADNLLAELKKCLSKCNLSWSDLEGIVVFRGPGSFTSLRIGLTVVNTISYIEGIPIIGEIGAEWELAALKRLKNMENDKIVLPYYGSEAHITLPKK